MMATYFNGGSEIQADNLQTLYLMNRGGYATYSDATQPSSGGVLLLNSGAGASSQQQPNSLNQGAIQHAPTHLASHHHLVGIPLAGANSPAGDEISGHLVPRFHYNLWAGGDPSPSGSSHHIPTAIAVSGTGDLGSPMGFRQPAQGGLSLSLNNSSPHKPLTTVLSPGNGTPTSASGVTNGVGAPGVILGSKFLKATQELLDEVVNVGKEIHVADGSKEKAKAAVVSAGEGSSVGVGQGGATVPELTTAQRQELQMKKAKLLNMLDEVEQRYRQYHSQMQVVAASFEQAAGPGSAKSYTALALETISKQFRCLKDAIAEQIKATGKSLGEESEDDHGKNGEGRSRLRMVDHQLRQQRALQQLGMMHHNAWRPQRGLPERAVSVLRAWLFEHFLHPYPKDSDKHMLAKQTGLTRSQVSNWFINARVRLWKPMVEEMYLEEMKSHDQQQNPSDNLTTTTTDTNKDSTTTPKSTPTLHSRHYNQNPQNHHMTVNNNIINNNPNPSEISSTGPTPTLHTQIGPLQGFSLIGSSESDPKRQRILTSDVMHNLNHSSPSNMMTSSMDHNNNHNKDMKPGRDLFPSDLSGFGPYPVGDIGSRFNPDPNHVQYHHGNAVSLTLGLPHCDQSLSLAGTHQNFLARIGEAELCGIDTSQQPPHSGGGYEGGINDVQNRSSWRSTLI